MTTPEKEEAPTTVLIPQKYRIRESVAVKYCSMAAKLDVVHPHS